MRLYPSVGLDHLLGECGRRQDLRHQRIRIQRNRRDQRCNCSGVCCVYGGRGRKGNIGVYLDAIGTVTPVYTDSITSQVNGWSSPCTIRRVSW
jgi:hypothetical protein